MGAPLRAALALISVDSEFSHDSVLSISSIVSLLRPRVGQMFAFALILTIMFSSSTSHSDYDSSPYFGTSLVEDGYDKMEKLALL